MRFVDFLKTTVLLSAGAATALGAVAVIGAANRGETRPALVSIAVWLVCGLAGWRLSRHGETTPPIARLLASAKATTTLPEQRPAAVLLNRLWGLLAFTLVCGGLSFLAPQVPGIAAGVPIVLALSLSRQDAAVQAIEDRDGAVFYVGRTSPLRPIALERAPGFKASRPQSFNGATR